MKFRKKPVVVEAVQWDGTITTLCLLHSMGMRSTSYSSDPTRRDGASELVIKTLEGSHEVSIGDWIIKGIRGDFFPRKPDLFELTYEPMEVK